MRVLAPDRLEKRLSRQNSVWATPYDFDEGVMSFFAPRQVSILDPGEVLAKSGWLLSIHPDFLRTFPLGKK
ncbi:hypothetical protein [Larkinella harenae]